VIRVNLLAKRFLYSKVNLGSEARDPRFVILVRGSIAVSYYFVRKIGPRRIVQN
jgi:hypothetical protein